jgi:hypothetical protein
MDLVKKCLAFESLKIYLKILIPNMKVKLNNQFNTIDQYK